VKGTAIAQPIRFKIVAGMQSGPVAFDSSSSLKSFAVYLERRATNSSNSESGLPKKGQSTLSSGSTALATKVLAKTSALSFELFTHSVPSLSGGIDEHLLFCIVVAD
jgi:hypothetical protein